MRALLHAIGGHESAGEGNRLVVLTQRARRVDDQLHGAERERVHRPTMRREPIGVLVGEHLLAGHPRDRLGKPERGAVAFCSDQFGGAIEGDRGDVDVDLDARCQRVAGRTGHDEPFVVMAERRGRGAHTPHDAAERGRPGRR